LTALPASDPSVPAADPVPDGARRIGLGLRATLPAATALLVLAGSLAAGAATGPVPVAAAALAAAVVGWVASRLLVAALAEAPLRRAAAALAQARTDPEAALPQPPTPELRELLGAADALRLALRDAAARERSIEAEHVSAASRLRHDLRGALAPAMLIADRLMMAEDADRKRAGDVVSRAVTRAADLLRKPNEAEIPRR
jgi:signal transduction histidine kinase